MQLLSIADDMAGLALRQNSQSICPHNPSEQIVLCLLIDPRGRTPSSPPAVLPTRLPGTAATSLALACRGGSQTLHTLNVPQLGPEVPSDGCSVQICGVVPGPCRDVPCPCLQRVAFHLLSCSTFKLMHSSMSGALRVALFLLPGSFSGPLLFRPEAALPALRGNTPVKSGTPPSCDCTSVLCGAIGADFFAGHLPCRAAGQPGAERRHQTGAAAVGGAAVHHPRLRRRRMGAGAPPCGLAGAPPPPPPPHTHTHTYTREPAVAHADVPCGMQRSKSRATLCRASLLQPSQPLALRTAQTKLASMPAAVSGSLQGGRRRQGRVGEGPLQAQPHHGRHGGGRAPEEPLGAPYSDLHQPGGSLPGRAVRRHCRADPGRGSRLHR